jgi:hypothetical protein
MYPLKTRPHPVPKADIARLVKSLNASAIDPLHLSFFMLEHRKAKLYSGRDVVEDLQGELLPQDLTPSFPKFPQVQALKNAFQDDELSDDEQAKQIAASLDKATLKGKGKSAGGLECGPNQYTNPLRKVSCHAWLGKGRYQCSKILSTQVLCGY